MVGLSLSVLRYREQEPHMKDLTANLNTNCAYIFCFINNCHNVDIHYPIYGAQKVEVYYLGWWPD